MDDNITKVIETLNRIHEVDPTVLPALIEFRVPCNDALAGDPTIQVGQRREEDGWEVGFLGILNGVLGIREDGWGHVTAHYSAGKLTHFKLTVR